MRAPTVLFLAALVAGCEGRAAAGPRVASVGRCPGETVATELGCLAPEAALTAPEGRTFVVDAASGDDRNAGTAEAPWRTISRATGAGVLQPGDAVLIRAGVYREAVRPEVGGTGPEARVTFAAAPGETVVVTGADPADDGWRGLRDGTWARPWQGPSMETYTDDPLFRREMLVADGEVLRPMASRSDLAPGTFWVDGPPQAPVRLVARFPGDVPPEAAGPVEVATRTLLFSPQGPDPYAECGDPSTPGWVRVVGITFRYATNRAQWGAVCAGSEGSLFEDVTVEWTNGRGVDTSGRGHAFHRTRADNHGQLGWGGACTGCLIEGSAAVGNNWKGHNPFWEAGGGKWIRTSQTVIRRHFAAYNEGPGIWLDGDNRDNTIEGALVVGNEVAGIMLELNTTRTLVQHNVVAATRWRSWSGAGILSQAASGNVFLHNTVEANEGSGLWLRLDPDRRAPDGDNWVLNNRLVGNAASSEEAREIQIEGLSLDHVRSNRLDGNVYGAVSGDGVLRSTFFANTIGGSEYRGSDLRAWRSWTGQDRRSATSSSEAAVGVLVPPAIGLLGARRAPVRTGPAAGADPDRVRARGAWRGERHDSY